MKKFGLIILMSIMSTLAVSANNDKSEKETASKLRNQIEVLLKSYENNLTNSLKATVKFIVNNKQEIIVLSVDTSDKNLSSFIKQRLNYKKVAVKEVKSLETYTIPVKFKKA